LQQLVPHLREYAKERMPEYMIPASWTLLKQMPLTSNGKINRRALPIPQAVGDEFDEGSAPRTDLELGLASIWEELLQIDRVGVRDNFFELGGHSMASLRLIAKVAESFGVQLSAAAVFQYPTLREMAQVMEMQLIESEERVPSRQSDFDEGAISL